MPKQTFSISPDAPWLAPLAGWSDLPFRLLCREEGAEVTCTEMISAKGLVYGGKNTKDLLATHQKDDPLVAQIFGAEHDFMEKSVAILQKHGFQYFDVNVGCSVAKVAKTGSGAAMLRDIPNLLKVAEHVINQVHNPISIENLDIKNRVNSSEKCPNGKYISEICNTKSNVNAIEGLPEKNVKIGKIGFKIRLGYEMEHDVYIDLAKELEKLGADWITLHPRYAKQRFTGVAKQDALIKLKSAVKIPVIASGDLFTANDGVRVLLETGVDAVMYARGAMANPFIFKEHKALWNHVQKEGLSVNQIPPMTEIRQRSESQMRDDLGKLISKHLEYAKEFNPHRSLFQMRTIVPRYVKHLDNAKSLRLALIACRSHEELSVLLNDYFGM